MKKVLIPTKLDKVVAKILTDAGFEVVQVPDKPILDLAKENADAQVVIVRSEKVTPEVMDQLPQLKLVVRAGAGYDNIDTKYARRRNVDVMNTPGANSNAVAEEVVALALAAYRKLVPADESTRAGKWEKSKFMGHEITGKTLGILGLGNIGAYAAMPVMEGKCVLFKEFGDVNAVPICLDTQDTEEIIATIKNIAPAYGGINLEDISAPRCFEIEERLKEMLDIPVFHDDQHGTAIVVLAGIINGLRVTGKKKEDCRVVVNGAGSAGVAITKLLLTYGFRHVTMCDREGIIGKDYPNLNWMQQKMTEVTNLEDQHGTLADALKGADIFVGVSAPNIVTPEMVASMNHDSILFAMANPVPEIMPDVAKAAGARIVGTGRSDFPNQVNNVVAFPGIFKGALEGRATQITEEMKLAAAEAIAGLVSDEELNDEFIMPEAFDPRVAQVVSEAVRSHIVR